MSSVDLDRIKSRYDGPSGRVGKCRDGLPNIGEGHCFRRSVEIIVSNGARREKAPSDARVGLTPAVAELNGNGRPFAMNRLGNGRKGWHVRISKNADVVWIKAPVRGHGC